MKTQYLHCFATATASLLAVLPLHAQQTSSANAEPKPYTLFMGADIAIERDKALFPLVDVKGESFVIAVNGKQQMVRPTHGGLSLKLTNALKLTTISATVTDLSAEPAYTPGIDPELQVMRQTMAMQNYSADMADLDAGKLRSYQDAEQRAEKGKEHNPYYAQDKQAAADGIRSAQASMTDSANFGRTVETQQHLIHRDDAEFDAVRVTFRVSSPISLDDPYVVMIARYRQPNTPPGKSRQWFFAKSINPIASKPVTVDFLQGGFPPGFLLEATELHLYNHGREVATSVSPKRAALSENEAFQYLVLDHIGSNKGATLPASPAIGRLSPDVRAALVSALKTDAVFVKVSKDGLPMDVFADESCTEKVDARYADSIKTFRFKPALRSGKPVDGVARVTLGKQSL